MVQCNNPKCGVTRKGERPKICPVCGFVMKVMPEPPKQEKKKSKEAIVEMKDFSKEAQESIKRGLKQKGTIDRGSFAKYAEEPEGEE